MRAKKIWDMELKKGTLASWTDYHDQALIEELHDYYRVKDWERDHQPLLWFLYLVVLAIALLIFLSLRQG